jgi:hypothetical protein
LGDDTIRHARNAQRRRLDRRRDAGERVRSPVVR